DVPHITHGSEVEPLPPGEMLAKLGLEPRKYILFVGRLVPENRVEHLIDAFLGLQDPKGMKCVIVGGSAYTEKYRNWLRRRASKSADIIFTDYVFGEGYRELSSHPYCFV